MHNRALYDTLAAFVEEAADQLADEVAGGAEVPFELVSAAPKGAAPLYCYRPQTRRFLAERSGAFGRLPSHLAAIRSLAALPGLPAYLRAQGRRAADGDPRGQAESALHALVSAVWEDATEFTFELERFARAYTALEDAVYAGASLSVVATAVEGLVIESPHVALGDGLRLVRGRAAGDVPEELRADPYATVAVLAVEQPTGQEADLERAGRRLRRLQTALRLWDPEPALGAVAWARTDGGPWLAVPLPAAVRRGRGDCLVAPEDEDPLRAFCALVARRTPNGGELAWALRRFELGCERPTPLEALTDWLLCARALLGEPGVLGHAELAERLAAICATPEERPALMDRLRRAIAMERAVVAGLVRSDAAVDALVGGLGGCLRAVLRDVLCGHLDPDLRRVADTLLADVAPTV